MGRKPGPWGAIGLWRRAALHFVIAIGTTLSIVTSIHQDTPFIVASKETFYDMLLNSDQVSRDGHRGYFFEVNACVKAVNQSLVTFYQLPAVGLDAYEVPASEPVALRVVQFVENPRLARFPVIKLDPKAHTHTHQSLETATKFYNITSPMDDWLLTVDVHNEREKRAFFNRLVEMEFTFSLRTLHKELDHFQEFDWTLQTRYDLTTRGGRIEMSVHITGNHMHLNHGFHWELVVGSMLAALCLLSQLLTMQVPLLVVQLPLLGTDSSAKRDPLFFWMTTVANVANVVGVIIGFGEYAGAPIAKRSVTQGVMGFACLLSWGSLVQHFEYMPPYEASMLAVRRGLPIVLRFVVGSFPLFMGFACFGMTLYSEHSIKFNSLRNSLVTLFSLMNGDVLLETARDIKTGFLGDVYLVTFVCIFTFTIVSVFVSIIQDAYASAKRQSGLQDIRIIASSALLAERSKLAAVNTATLMAKLTEQMESLNKQVQDVRALQEALGMVLKHQAREEGNLDLGTRSVSPPRAASPPHTLQNEAAMPGLHHRATSATHT